jgi:hypothetical protein
MALVTVSYVLFFRSPCDAQSTGNAKWGGRKGSCSGGYLRRTNPGRSKFLVCDGSVLGLCIATYSMLPDGIEKRV